MSKNKQYRIQMMKNNNSDNKGDYSYMDDYYDNFNPNDDIEMFVKNVLRTAINFEFHLAKAGKKLLTTNCESVNAFTYHDFLLNYIVNCKTIHPTTKDKLGISLNVLNQHIKWCLKVGNEIAHNRFPLFTVDDIDKLISYINNYLQSMERALSIPEIEMIKSVVNTLMSLNIHSWKKYDALNN